MKNDPAFRGIFVQRALKNKYVSKSDGKIFCVTFPRLANIGGNDTDILFPSDYFPTFESAKKFALQVKRIDTRLSKCPVYLCDHRWVRSSAVRELQLIG